MKVYCKIPWMTSEYIKRPRTFWHSLVGRKVNNWTLEHISDDYDKPVVFCMTTEGFDPGEIDRSQVFGALTSIISTGIEEDKIIEKGIELLIVQIRNRNVSKELMDSVLNLGKKEK